jgi:hypothetical protein
MKLSGIKILSENKDTGLDEEATVVTLVIFKSQVETILASYDPTATTSPSAADSRSIARPICDLLLSLEGN